VEALGGRFASRLRRAAGSHVERQQGNRAPPSSVAMEAMIFIGGEIGDICP
jgi:hypothetical protein